MNGSPEQARQRGHFLPQTGFLPPPPDFPRRLPQFLKCCRKSISSCRGFGNHCRRFGNDCRELRNSCRVLGGLAANLDAFAANLGGLAAFSGRAAANLSPLAAIYNLLPQSNLQCFRSNTPYPVISDTFSPRGRPIFSHGVANESSPRERPEKVRAGQPHDGQPAGLSKIHTTK